MITGGASRVSPGKQIAVGGLGGKLASPELLAFYLGLIV